MIIVAILASWIFSQSVEEIKQHNYESANQEMLKNDRKQYERGV